MTMQEQWSAEFKVSDVQATQRIISGFAAGIGNTDRVSDVIVPGAFTKTLASKPPGDVGVFIGHKTDSLPVGIPLVIREQAGGLYTETLIKPGPAGDDLLATAEFLQRHGKALGMSIGYRVAPGGATLERGRDGQTVRKLTNVDLLEFSYAAAQSIANEQALVTGVKAMQYRIEARGDTFVLLDAQGEMEGTYTTRAAAEAEMRRLQRDGDEAETPMNRGKTMAWDAAYLASLPDSAFLRVDPGEQEAGRTVPASKRHHAYRDAEGKICVDRLEAALPALGDDLALQGRVRWLLAQPESKLAAADTVEWQQGAAPELYGLQGVLGAIAEDVADEQKAQRRLGQDVQAGQLMRPAQCAALRTFLAQCTAVLDNAELINAGQLGPAKVQHYQRELELLELAG